MSANFIDDYVSLIAKSKTNSSSKRKRSSLPEDVGDELDGPWAPVTSVETVVPVLTLSDGDNPQSNKEQVEPTPIPSTKTASDEKPAPSDMPNEEAIDDPTMHIVEPDEEAEKWEKVNERKLTFTLPPRPPRGSVASSAKTTFHGPEEVDYQGRSWTAAPSGIRPEEEFGDHDCFIPKKCIRKFTGHTKGVHAIEFFPGTGHLLLSCSMDGKCKIWDVYEDRNVRRTYVGHTEAVR